MTYTLLIDTPLNRQRLHCLANDVWYDYVRLSDLYQNLLQINFSVVAQRDLARELLNLDGASQIFSFGTEDIRFPAEGSWLPSTDPYLQNVFVTLFQALSFRDRNMTRDDFPNFSSAYYNALRQFNFLLTTVTRFHTRQTFESFYQLSWTEL